MMNQIPTLNALLLASHRAAVAGGWWSDPATGEPIERNRGELLALVHSEISEGFDASLTGLLDDKLSTRPGAEVELADAFIRLGDYVYGFGHAVILPEDDDEGVEVLTRDAVLEAGSTDQAWARLHSLCSKITEHERKNRAVEAAKAITDLLGFMVAYAVEMKYDLIGAIQEKIAFNAQRADHKPEARLQDDGKKF